MVMEFMALWNNVYDYVITVTKVMLGILGFMGEYL
jgi:hypothetical protein